MTNEEFEALPSSFIVREVCLRIKQRGFRDERIIVVTTLVDAQRYTVKKLTALYGLRWSAAEVNLRYLKTTLKMEMLTAKTRSDGEERNLDTLISLQFITYRYVAGCVFIRKHSFSTLIPIN